MGKLFQIYQGIKNYFDKDPEIEKMAEERIKICSKCVDKKGEPMIRYAIKPFNLYLHCRKCKCFYMALARSPDKHCSLNKF